MFNQDFDNLLYRKDYVIQQSQPIQLESVAKISNLQYIEVLQSYGNPNTLKCFNILKCFNLMKVTIGLQHFNILGYHRIAIL